MKKVYKVPYHVLALVSTYKEYDDYEVVKAKSEEEAIEMVTDSLQCNYGDDLVTLRIDEVTETTEETTM